MNRPGSPLRVLLTHELFPPDFAGGGEWHVLQTARFLRRRGVDVHVLTTGDPAVTSFDGIPTTRLATHRYGMNLAARTIAKHARDATLIQTFNFHACFASSLAARWLGKPIVCGMLGVYGEVWREMKGPVLGPLWARWERSLLKRPFSRLVFLSDYSRRLAIEMGAPRDRSVVIPTAVELERYAPAPQKTNEVLFVGKFDVRKGVYELLAAARLVPNVPFRLIGWGPEHQKLAAAAPPNVTIETLEKGSPPVAAFARASIFALPSHSEGMSRAVLEAMASGCAIVSCMPGDFKGRQVPVGDAERLAAAIRDLWFDQALARACGQRNFETAQRYSWDAHTTALLSVYTDVMGAQHEAARRATLAPR